MPGATGCSHIAPCGAVLASTSLPCIRLSITISQTFEYCKAREQFHVSKTSLYHSTCRVLTHRGVPNPSLLSIIVNSLIFEYCKAREQFHVSNQSSYFSICRVLTYKGFQIPVFFPSPFHHYQFYKFGYCKACELLHVSNQSLYYSTCSFQIIEREGVPNRSLLSIIINILKCEYCKAREQFNVSNQLLYYSTCRVLTNPNPSLLSIPLPSLSIL